MHTRQISSYGGIVSIMPKYSVLLMIFTLGAIGLPGTSGFIGEFLILLATFKKHVLVAAIASTGIIVAAAYMLWLYKRVIFGEILNNNIKKMVDINKSEAIILSCLAIPVIFFGFYPDPLISTTKVSISNLLEMYNSNLSLNLNNTINE